MADTAPGTPEIAPFITSIDINAPIQRVWDEITRSGMCRAMFETVYHRDLAPGKPFRYSCPSGKRTFVFGEFLEVEPPRRLVHTFNSTFDTVNAPETLVTWTLAETAPGKTRITLKHEKWTSAGKTYKGVSKGWLEILGLFKSQIETGAFPLKTRLRNRMMAVMSFMMPKSTLTSSLDQKFQRVA